MRPLEHRARWILNIGINAYLVYDSEFMFSVLAGGNVKMYDLHSFHSNVEGDASKTSGERRRTTWEAEETERTGHTRGRVG